ncbi:MAG: carbon storage regulator CsrA [Candidatus Thiodiazotropha lotti]|nr:carbon storage regulator CsrA [Candidatus Thiodiazotropha lotti]MCW4222711.1 carbon storage regulator CsrA [Candidatus Thiodiazotropha lotti]
MALVLTRRPGESLMIGDDITISISRVNGNQVHVAVDAPKSISVDRSEVRMRKDREKRWHSTSASA